MYLLSTTLWQLEEITITLKIAKFAEVIIFVQNIIKTLSDSSV